jgi:hypothetical protein
LRASLIAASLASAPELAKYTLPPSELCGQPVGQPPHRLGVEQVRDVDQAADLLAHRLDHARVAVADVADRDPGQEIEVLVAVGVEQRAAGPRDELDVEARVVGLQRAHAPAAPSSRCPRR